MTNFEKIKNELENLEEIYPICYIAVHKLGLSRNDGECDDTCCQKCEKEVFKWLFEENEESNSILTDEERKYLSTVFEPFKERIKYVQKEIEIYSGYDTADGEEDEPVTNMAIYIHFLNNTFSGLPFFDEKMFANMENYKDYTLEELGL